MPGQWKRRLQAGGAETLIAHTRSRGGFLQAFGTPLCRAEAQSGSAATLPYVSQLLEVQSLRGLALPVAEGSQPRCALLAPASALDQLLRAILSHCETLVFSGARGH